MTLFNAVASLERVSIAYDGAGNPTETVSSRDVFVDRYSIGAATWLAARAAGLHADVELSLRSCDYQGEQRLSMDGIIYEVERVSDRGEFTRLTLARRLNDVPPAAPVTGGGGQ